MVLTWRWGIALLAAWVAWNGFAAGSVLIVADELPAMELLATGLKAGAQVECRVVKQTELPAKLSQYRAVIVYIHGRLDTGPEQAFIDYALEGGKLIALHHSISSGKRTNSLWFPFLGVTLPPGGVEQGGYKWIEPVTLQIVNLAPDHPVTTRGVEWPEKTVYSMVTGSTREASAVTLHEAEVYLNHRLIGPRTVLLGFKYTDSQTGRTWMQETAGWSKRVGKGTLYYFQPGHSVRDFEQPVFTRILVNSVRQEE